MKVSVSVRLFTDQGDKCFGPGIAELLSGIEQTGSIRKAAQGMQMAYSKAWRVVNACEAALGTPLLDRQTGGATGGQSALTPAARALLASYQALAQTLQSEADAFPLPGAHSDTPRL